LRVTWHGNNPVSSFLIVVLICALGYILVCPPAAPLRLLFHYPQNTNEILLIYMWHHLHQREPAAPPIWETVYGYPGDRTPDWNSSHGIGAGWATHPLIAHVSVAISEKSGRAWGLRHNQKFIARSGLPSEWNDVCPYSGHLDRYEPNHPPDKFWTGYIMCP
jgi:hypothetical protein